MVRYRIFRISISKSIIALPAHAMLSCLLLVQCSQPAPQASFVTTLGKDTLVIEQFSMHPDHIEAEVLMRSPQVELMRQSLTLDADGSIKEFRSESYPAGQLSGAPSEVLTMQVEGDSLVVIRQADTTLTRRSVLLEGPTLPWMDMVHWPYEVATRQLSSDGAGSLDQHMFAGRGVSVFEVRALGTDSVSIKHPYRGTMYARTDASGAILLYDATETTRKLIVKRGGPLDMASMAAAYADKPIRSLSGEGESRATVHGATIELTFGQPARRGRELFGGIVPWGEIWRTGANRATHLKTDSDLVVGDLEVPAGEYTLFTIPEPGGGTLIINRETGQNGNSYDPEQDLGRTPMAYRSASESVELFSVEALDSGDAGELQLKWGTDVFTVPFQVATPD